MLTDEQKIQNKEKYISLLQMAEVYSEELVAFLESINYFEAPFSAQRSYSYAGGLCEYSLKLAHEMGVLGSHYFKNKYTAADILKVALFKEVYRAFLYKITPKNVKNDETGKWEVTYIYSNNENRPVFGDLGLSSYMLMRKFIDFSDEQMEAIIQQNNLTNYSSDIYEVSKTYPLVTIARMAYEVVIFMLEE